MAKATIDRANLIAKIVNETASIIGKRVRNKLSSPDIKPDLTYYLAYLESMSLLNILAPKIWVTNKMNKPIDEIVVDFIEHTKSLLIALDYFAEPVSSGSSKIASLRDVHKALTKLLSEFRITGGYDNIKEKIITGGYDQIDRVDELEEVETINGYVGGYQVSTLMTKLTSIAELTKSADADTLAAEIKDIKFDVLNNDTLMQLITLYDVETLEYPVDKFNEYIKKHTGKYLPDEEISLTKSSYRSFDDYCKLFSTMLKTITDIDEKILINVAIDEFKKVSDGEIDLPKSEPPENIRKVWMDKIREKTQKLCETTLPTINIKLDPQNYLKSLISAVENPKVREFEEIYCILGKTICDLNILWDYICGSESAPCIKRPAVLVRNYVEKAVIEKDKKLFPGGKMDMKVLKSFIKEVQ